MNKKIKRIIYLLSIVSILFGLIGIFFLSNYIIPVRLLLFGILLLVTITVLGVLTRDDLEENKFKKYGLMFSIVGISFFIIGFIKSNILFDYWHYGLATLLIGVGIALYNTLKSITINLEGLIPKYTPLINLISVLFLATIIGCKIQFFFFYPITIALLGLSSLLSILIIAKKASN